MSPVSTFPDVLALLASFFGMLGVLWLAGRLLVPTTLLPGRRMLRLAVVMGSGLLFVTGVAALLCLRHMHVTTWLALAQVLGTALWTWHHHRRQRAGTAIVTPPSDSSAATPAEAPWSMGDRLAVLGVALGVAFLAMLLVAWWRPGGAVHPLHEDMGFYVSQVLALPEAHAANPWSIFMGEHTVAATGVRDTWYHWGAMLLAAGLRAVTGLDAAPALLLVVNGALTIILMLAAAALADVLWRLRPGAAALAGAGAILGMHLVRLVPSLLDVLAHTLPFDVFHHVRVTLVMTLPYKYEGVLLLLVLALWQARHPRLALAMLYAAACSAPHSVAVVGAAAGTLAGLGVLLRDRALLRTGAAATGAVLAGWATMHALFGAGLADKQGAPAMGIAPLAELPQVLRNAALDIPATALMSAFFVAGAVFLVRQGQRRTSPRASDSAPHAATKSAAEMDAAAAAIPVAAPTPSSASASGPSGPSGPSGLTSPSAIGARAAKASSREAAAYVDADADARRQLGWLCLSGLGGSLLAMHALRCGDRYHVVMLTHAALVMPVGVCGLLGMARLLSGWQRTAAVAVLASVVALGLHAQLAPLFKTSHEAWGAQDIAGLRAQLQGRPVGYFARQDRNWWISKHALLGGLAGSRVLRLNPLDERPSIHYSPHASTLPLQWVPPQADENTSDWCLRLAQKLGIQHVLETAEDRLPKRLRDKCRPVWSGSGLMLYELPPSTSAATSNVAGR